jgi:nucleotide-binding universal stress UspA family protein
MGRDRNLPTWFGKVHQRRKTPHWAILASAVLIAFMAAALPIEVVASAADIMFLLLFIQVLVVLIALRKKRPDLQRGFKVPLVPYLPLIGIVLQLGLAVVLFFYSPMAWLSAGAWIVIGLVVYYTYARRRDRAHEQLVAVREAADLRKYRILACIGNLQSAETVLDAAVALAKQYEGELIALSVVEVPDRQLLRQGVESARKTRHSLECVLDKVRKDGVPSMALVKISHRISFGIIETALEERCNLIVMGRVRRAGLLERFAATIVDRVVRSAPAQVVTVSAERWPEKATNLLFAYEPGPHSELAADLAGALGKAEHAKVRAVHVLPRTATKFELKRAQEEIDRSLGERLPQSERQIIQASDIVTALLRESRDADVIITGGTDAGMLEQLLGYAPPLELAERTSVPVVTVYEMPAEPRRWML